MELNAYPIFRDLSLTEQAGWLAQADTRYLAAGDVLCYEGDPAATLYALVNGTCQITRTGEAQREPDSRPILIDPLATLGGLPHSLKLEATTACELLSWPFESLWQSAEFATAARRYLAETARSAETRLNELEQPVHYAPDTAHLTPGPFMFEDVTLIFAFCDADLDPIRAQLPDGLSLFRRPGRKRDSLMIALAHFPTAYSEHDPAARFGYTETTIFVPVRYRHSIGLFVPYIYPSAYEPILLGREIYGFPKRLGRTTFGAQSVALAVDNTPQLDLRWNSSAGTDEPRLVRALIDWIGLEGRSLSLAFQAGDVLRKTMRLPPYRRVGVYNHKRIPAPETNHDAPVYTVDQLTFAIFGVLRWYQIAQLHDPALEITGGPLAAANVTLREAYRTRLDMRLSTGRVVRDYASHLSTP